MKRKNGDAAVAAASLQSSPLGYTPGFSLLAKHNLYNRFFLLVVQTFMIRILSICFRVSRLGETGSSGIFREFGWTPTEFIADEDVDSSSRPPRAAPRFYFNTIPDQERNKDLRLLTLAWVSFSWVEIFVVDSVCCRWSSVRGSSNNLTLGALWLILIHRIGEPPWQELNRSSSYACRFSSYSNPLPRLSKNHPSSLSSLERGNHIDWQARNIYRPLPARLLTVAVQVR